jgi:hypothetical protein
MAGRFKLSRAPLTALRCESPRNGRLSNDAKKMRFTDFCNRPTTRAPSGLPDSQVRSPPRFEPLRAFSSTIHASPRLANGLL